MINSREREAAGAEQDGHSFHHTSIVMELW